MNTLFGPVAFAVGVLFLIGSIWINRQAGKLADEVKVHLETCRKLNADTRKMLEGTDENKPTDAH